tara:strand:- start:410 stop:1030 length:621 start_codon:yes stop_codon:yes gene_type:complete
MATQTYAILVQDIKDLTENNSSDFATQADEFIETTEIRLSREIKNCPELFKHQTSTLTISDPFITKPSDLISMISFQVLSSAAARTGLEYRDVSFINEYWPTRTSTGTPKYYADWDDDYLIVAPTPSAALTIEMNYRKRFDAISGSSTTSWLTANAYDALLYGSLIEAAIYDKNPQMMQIYEKRYTEALASINNELAVRRTDGFTS